MLGSPSRTSSARKGQRSLAPSPNQATDPADVKNRKAPVKSVQKRSTMSKGYQRKPTMER